MKFKQCLKLFYAFSKVGALTFGGGYAMLPMLQREIVEKNKWASESEVLDYFALGQCAPGAIAVNTAVFIGREVAGVAGGIAAALGVVFPSLIIITIIAAILSNFADLPIVKNAFEGIRVCVCVLIFNVIVRLWKMSVPDIAALIIFFAVFIGSMFTDISPIIFVLVAAAAGIIVKKWTARVK